MVVWERLEGRKGLNMEVMGDPLAVANGAAGGRGSCARAGRLL